MNDVRYRARPQPGFFKRRAYARGPWLPARLYRRIPLDPETGEVLERPEPLVGEIDGREVEWRDVWEGCHESNAEEFKWLTALSAIRKR